MWKRTRTILYNPNPLYCICWLLFFLSVASLKVPQKVNLFCCSKKLIPYQKAWDWQNQLVEQHIKLQNNVDESVNDKTNTVGSLLVLEHSPVYTLGTGTQPNSGPFSSMVAMDGSVLDYDTIKVDRAGQATFHGPGQIVMYPILDLHYFQQDIHQYLRSLEQVVIATLNTFGISAGRVAGATGVWSTGLTALSEEVPLSAPNPASDGSSGRNSGGLGRDDKKLSCKIAALGIKLKRWVTMHGVSVNVNPDMRYFSNIVPCGIADKAVGSVAQFRPDVTLDQVKAELLRQFAVQFNVKYSPILSCDAAVEHLDKLARY